MKIKLAGVCFMFFGFYTQLLAGSWILNPITADFLLISEDFDFTKKGNVYEKTFRMPYDFWMNKPDMSVKLHFGFPDELATIKRVENSDFTTLPIQNIKDFYYRLKYVWLPYNSWHECGYPCHLTPEDKDKVIKLLEAYHPNQYFKFKITFIPLANPNEKQEKIIEFPLYFVSNKQDYPTGYQGICLMDANLKTWRKYYVKLEVLEDTILPNGTIPFITIASSARK